MGDLLKAFGIWAIFCILACCIQCLEAAAIGAACTEDNPNCTAGMSMSSGFINCIVCITCLFLVYKAMTENKVSN